jgi:hypothetical protein
MRIIITIVCISVLLSGCEKKTNTISFIPIVSKKKYLVCYYAKGANFSLTSKIIRKNSSILDLPKLSPVDSAYKGDFLELSAEPRGFLDVTTNQYIYDEATVTIAVRIGIDPINQTAIDSVIVSKSNKGSVSVSVIL